MKQIISLLFVLTAFAGLLSAQNSQTAIGKEERSEVVRSIGKILSDFYIFPKKGEEAANFISENLSGGVYDAISNPAEFAERITNDVISITHDKHFRLFFDPQRVVDERKSVNAKEKTEILKREIAVWRKENFGFKEVKILDGNIGYINLTGFYDLKYGKETAAAAMNFLSNTDALILDLRANHGGASDMAQFISGYFFETKPVLLYDFYERKGRKTLHTQYSTLPVLSGKRRASDLYILTSNFTFSASEGLSYSLQNLKRAVIIGETTGGGANMWTGKIVSERFFAHIPSSRPVDPRTRTNWEEIGVRPDIETASSKALITAQITALEKLDVKFPDRKNEYAWFLPVLKAELTPVRIESSTLKSYAGTFGDKEITIENGKPFFHWRGANVEMIPLAQDLFRTAEFNFFRIKMNVEGDKITGITILNDNGTSRSFAKDK